MSDIEQPVGGRAPSGEAELKALFVLFFFSGFPALIYQLVWQRSLFRIFGVNIESVTITVTAFMLGLGLGNLIGGVLSKRTRLSPLILLAAIEILTGIFGFFSLAVFEKVGTLALGQPQLIMACVTLGLVLIPTLLMGATLPLLVAYAVRVSGSVGGSVGKLYYVNTLGAGAVCLIAAALLFPFLGMQKSVDVAVLMNAAVAGSALLLFRRSRSVAPMNSENETVASVAAPPVLRMVPTLGLSFLSGFVALSYEIFFFRILSYGSGSSATVFAVTLGAFLVGLASGSRVAAKNCRQDAATIARQAIRSLLVASIFGFLFLPLLSHMGFLKTGILGIAILVIYLWSRSWGVLLPSLAHLGVAADREAGLKTAWLYVANIAGSVIGSILTGFVFMDHVGTIVMGQGLVLAGLLCAVLLVAALPRNIGQDQWKPVGGGGLIVAALTIFLMPVVATSLLENLLWKGARDASVPFARVVENRHGILTVDQEATLYGNGIYDGIFNTDLLNDHNGLLRPFALNFYHPAPRHVLEIGLASGSWAQIIANNPDVEDLTIVEINPGYLKLIAEKPEIASLLTNPKVTIVIDDGRRWLRLHPERTFDAIVSNTTYHFRAHAANLLSVEFLNLIKQHLNAGGTFFYNTTDSLRVQKTGCATFPYGARFSNHMLLSLAPVVWDMARWKQKLLDYRIDGKPVLDLTREQDRAFYDRLDNIADAVGYINPGKLIEPCPDILARTRDLSVVTDDNMGTEWRKMLGFVE